MMTYIKNKSIDCNKTNEVMYLKGIGEATWNFISTFYESEQNLLVSNKENCSFRQNFVAKFTSKLHETNMKTKNGIQVDKPASFVKIPLSIPMKLPKEVQEILKFFKKNTQPTERKDTRKSYAQVLSMLLSTNTSKILKIKQMFPKLQTKKIENIQKIINSKGRLKPKISMMTKDPSRKQVIIPMSNKNRSKFMEISSNYITDINRALKNIKFKIMADFV